METYNIPINAPIKKSANGLQLQIVTAQDAFQALLDGKELFARFTGNSTIEDEFLPVSDFSADIYVKPFVEFGIKIEMVNINGFEFSKPLTLSELTPGQVIYFVGSTNKILKGCFVESEILIDGALNGCLQASEENARLQLLAMRSLLGITPDIVIVDIDFTSQDEKKSEPKKTRGRKTKEEKTTAAKIADEPQVDPEPIADPVPSVDSIIKEIDDTTDLDALAKISLKIDKYIKYFTDDELNAIQTKFLEHKEHLSQLDLLPSDDEIQQQTIDLVSRAHDAKTIDAANDLAKYTIKWTEEQRAPVLKAIHNRIVELNLKAPLNLTDKPLPFEQPSLAVRIQNAQNLDELDLLKAEIQECNIFIQKKLTEQYEARRASLLKIGIQDE